MGGRTLLAHRVSFYFTRGRWPKPFCLHRCDNPKCVRPDHLFEGTHTDNVRDMVQKGRHPSQKLTIDDVRRIRRMIADGVSDTDIAIKYGVDRTNVSCIRRGKTWHHVS